MTATTPGTPGATRRSWEKLDDPPAEPPALDTLFSDFWLQNWEKISFYSFELPS